MSATLISIALVFNAVSVRAEEVEAETTEKHWSGEGELGYVSTTGNTDTMSLNAVLGIEYKLKQWEHKAGFEAFFLKDSGEIASERYMALFLSNYKLSERRYLFGRIIYEDDRFVGYDYTVSEALGYGMKLIKTDKVSLEFAIGPGARQSRSVSGDEEYENIIFVNGDFQWKLSKYASFRQEAFLEAGEKNTRSKSVTGLTTEIVGDLAMKLSYVLRHESQPVDGAENTDTKLSATLVYSF